MKNWTLIVACAGVLMSTAAAYAETPAAAPAESALATLDPAGALALVKTVDDRQRNSGDYKTLMYIERKEKDKNDVVFDAVIYRRDVDDKLMILFLQPKSERGKGYLRIDKNLWMYDPTVGKWERRTERERIGGTDSRRADFDESRLAEEYDVTYGGVEKLGAPGAGTEDRGRTADGGLSEDGRRRTEDGACSADRSVRCRAGALGGGGI